MSHNSIVVLVLSFLDCRSFYKSSKCFSVAVSVHFFYFLVVEIRHVDLDLHLRTYNRLSQFRKPFFLLETDTSCMNTNNRGNSAQSNCSQYSFSYSISVHEGTANNFDVPSYFLLERPMSTTNKQKHLHFDLNVYLACLRTYRMTRRVLMSWSSWLTCLS